MEKGTRSSLMVDAESMGVRYNIAGHRSAAQVNSRNADHYDR